MAGRPELKSTALSAMRSEPRIGPYFKPALLEIDAEGVATITAEVDSIAIKRLALKRLAALPEVSGVVDRIRVRPVNRVSDDGIRDHLRKAYVQEPAFLGLTIREVVEGEPRLVREALPESTGEIVIEVVDGVVIVNGIVPSRASKRLAGVLAWWVPGARDVVNGIAVEPPEEDGPINIQGAVRVALEKDPLVDASQIRVGVRGRTVHLTGLVRSDAARNAAEWDAWAVFGVDDIINDVQVGA